MVTSFAKSEKKKFFFQKKAVVQRKRRPANKPPPLYWFSEKWNSQTRKLISITALCTQQSAMPSVFFAQTLRKYQKTNLELSPQSAVQEFSPYTIHETVLAPCQQRDRRVSSFLELPAVKHFGLTLFDEFACVRHSKCKHRIGAQIYRTNSQKPPGLYQELEGARYSMCPSEAEIANLMAIDRQFTLPPPCPLTLPADAAVCVFSPSYPRLFSVGVLCSGLC